MDTIYALASARGKAGVAVIRLSGPVSHDSVVRLAGSVPPMRRAGLRSLRLGEDTLDEALVLAFPEGASFTGEEMAELHVHGGAATVSAVLRALSEDGRLRLAEPGEFTRRALFNGRLDLAQVEGIADLIDAETEAQRRQAMRVLSGAIGRKAAGWRTDLVRAGALLEAMIDFSEEDIPGNLLEEVVARVQGLLADLRREERGAGAAERVRDGFEVAIIGRPNSGKSTLLNRLAGRDAAITSAVAGTTRDVIEVRMEIGGLPVTLLDTAGLRESTDEVERIGIERAVRRAEAADVRLFLTEDGDLPSGVVPRAGDVIAVAKADLHPGAGMRVSGLTGAGVDLLLQELFERLSHMYGSAATITRERHRVAVMKAIEALESAVHELNGEAARIEIAADGIRACGRHLDRLVGRLDVETYLEEIFSSFCIGK